MIKRIRQKDRRSYLGVHPGAVDVQEMYVPTSAVHRIANVSKCKRQYIYIYNSR